MAQRTLTRYVVWIAGGHPRNGREIMAATSLEARQICAAAWSVPLVQVMARKAEASALDYRG